MIKKDLIKTLATKTGFTQKDISVVVDATFDTIAESMASKEDVKITGFGTFTTADRAAREGVNPLKPGEKIKIPAMTLPKFKASTTLKTKVKEANI